MFQQYELKAGDGTVLAKGSSQYLNDFVTRKYGEWGDRYIEVAVESHAKKLKTETQWSR